MRTVTAPGGWKFRFVRLFEKLEGVCGFGRFLKRSSVGSAHFDGLWIGQARGDSTGERNRCTDRRLLCDADSYQHTRASSGNAHA